MSPPTSSAFVQPQSRIFFKTLQKVAPSMQKVKGQHLAICRAIDVTQISREGVLGQSDPAIGKGLIGSLQVLRAADDFPEAAGLSQPDADPAVGDPLSS